MNFFLVSFHLTVLFMQLAVLWIQSKLTSSPNQMPIKEQNRPGWCLFRWKGIKACWPVFKFRVWPHVTSCTASCFVFDLWMAWIFFIVVSIHGFWFASVEQNAVLFCWIQRKKGTGWRLFKRENKSISFVPVLCVVSLNHGLLCFETLCPDGTNCKACLLPEMNKWKK